MATGSVKQALNGDTYCGDQWGHWQKNHQITLCIADGLGHGKFAQKASKAAMNYVASHLSKSLPEIFSGCNREIRDTRGVAMGIAIINKKDHTLIYAGVGNTRILILSGTDLTGAALRENACKPRYLKSDFGIVGGGYRRLMPEIVSFAPGDIVMMYTDGVKELIDFAGYKASVYKDIQLLSETIFVDWGRDTDDAAVLAYIWD